MTVKDLKKALEGLEDEIPVELNVFGHTNELETVVLAKRYNGSLKLTFASSFYWFAEDASSHNGAAKPIRVLFDPFFQKDSVTWEKDISKIKENWGWMDKWHNNGVSTW